ncbi:regulator of G-protein signaling 5-like [Megalops cyprinoides]|uniref:regulator of G-protein signaling 5-like n=1 Tax=Megalops cyprinoides TaxID=118141 RepID=UPI001863DA8B|nr:regulator of G-protein signaling 5-like [Megalops cyprinoides]
MCRGLASLPTTCLERAKGLKARFGCLFKKPDASHKMDKLRITPEESSKWRESFDKLLANKYGLQAFRAFLVSEFSEENIAFYLACEDYRSTTSTDKLSVEAKKIYTEFIGTDAPKEVNIDHETRAITKRNLECATVSCFDLAQSKIYSLMEKDCYPRFLQSAAYQELNRLLASQQCGSINERTRKWAHYVLGAKEIKTTLGTLLQKPENAIDLIIPYPEKQEKKPEKPQK